MALYAGGDIYTRKYKLTSVKEQNDKGVFFTTPVKPAGKPTDEELAKAKMLFSQFSGVDVAVEEETSATAEHMEVNF